jgi:hypothetical protein
MHKNVKIFINGVDFGGRSRYNYIVWNIVPSTSGRKNEKDYAFAEGKKGFWDFYGIYDKKRSKRRGVPPVV